MSLLMLKPESVQLVSVNTTAYSEENFLLVTDLTEQEITDIIYPIVFTERVGGESYSNEDLFWALKEAYPSNLIQLYFDPITITI